MAIEWIVRQEADRAGLDDERVLIEQTPDHYPEFHTFLQRELERAGGSLFFRGRSGLVYRVSPVKEHLEGLRGIEICLRTASARGLTVSHETVDNDLWSFLEWLVLGVGGEWTLDGLRMTGAIYRIPGAPARA